MSPASDLAQRRERDPVASLEGAGSSRWRRSSSARTERVASDALGRGVGQPVVEPRVADRGREQRVASR